MTTSEFLIAASREREYDWVLPPKSISQDERTIVLQQLPSRVHPETQIIEVTCGTKQLWVATRIEYTTDRSGRPLLDYAGRELRHSYGVVSNEPITLPAANNAIDSSRREIKESLASFLESNAPQAEVNGQLVSNIRGSKEELTMARSSLYVMRFATALAIILSVASMSYAYYSNRMVSELAQRIEDAEKKLGQVVKDQQKIDAIEAKLQKLAPTDGPK
jgi:hypothetical protein